MSEFAIAPAAILIVEHRQVMSHWAPCDGRSLTECRRRRIQRDDILQSFGECQVGTDAEI